MKIHVLWGLLLPLSLAASSQDLNYDETYQKLFEYSPQKDGVHLYAKGDSPYHPPQYEYSIFLPSNSYIATVTYFREFNGCDFLGCLFFETEKISTQQLHLQTSEVKVNLSECPNTVRLIELIRKSMSMSVATNNNQPPLENNQDGNEERITISHATQEFYYRDEASISSKLIKPTSKVDALVFDFSYNLNKCMDNALDTGMYHYANDVWDATQ